MTPQQAKALKLIVTSVVDTVRESGELGAPCGNSTVSRIVESLYK